MFRCEPVMRILIIMYCNIVYCMLYMDRNFLALQLNQFYINQNNFSTTPTFQQHFHTKLQILSQNREVLFFEDEKQKKI